MYSSDLEVCVRSEGRVFDEYILRADDSIYRGGQKRNLASVEQQLFFGPVYSKLPHAVVYVVPVGFAICRIPGERQTQAQIWVSALLEVVLPGELDAKEVQWNIPVRNVVVRLALPKALPATVDEGVCVS